MMFLSRAPEWQRQLHRSAAAVAIEKPFQQLRYVEPFVGAIIRDLVGEFL